ncbi:MAG: YdcF family protein [Deltaproteobacteria bacterium]|nr:YdcF family protein [Deltaproteobacteria bacterium]
MSVSVFALATALAAIPRQSKAQSESVAQVSPAPAAVASCPVETMDRLFPGPLPMNPYLPPKRASACLIAEHDVIIVLGCPNDRKGKPTTCQKRRVDLAVKLSKSGLGRRFIVTGASVHSPGVEAESLRKLLRQRGVAASAITLEPKARHTDENIYYSTRIMEAAGWVTALVVSDNSGQLFYNALCDSNCCVKKGRLTVAGFPTDGAAGKKLAWVGNYVRYPAAANVSKAECAAIQKPTKFMCVKLAERASCAGRLALPR